MTVSLSSLFNISPMPPNRRILALHQVRERAEARELSDIIEACDQAITHDEHSLSLETARLQERSGLSVDSTALDDRIDKTLTMIANLLEHYGKDTDPEISDKAGELRTTLFPDGLEHHINLPYAEQHVANEHVVTVLESPEHRAWIDEQGLRSLANRMRNMNASFGALLHTSDDQEPTVSRDDLRTERRGGHERLLQVVARIVGHYPTDDSAHARTELLQPILEQEQAVQISRRRHDTSSDD